MDKKGFTLIEVIGVVIILASIVLIITPNINNSLKNSKNKAFDVQIEEIKSATKSWVALNSENTPEEDNEEVIINLLQLKLSGLIAYDFKNPKTGELFPDDMMIKIIKKGLAYTYVVLTDTGTSNNSGIDPFGPQIVLNGGVYLYLEVGEFGSIPGATYKDKLGNNVSVSDITYEKDGVAVSGIDYNNLGKYVVTYSVTLDGKTNSIKRYVEIVDTKAPTILVDGYSDNVCVDIEISSSFTLPTMKVTDNYTSSLLIDKKVIGNISNIPGIKRITYRATDSSGNSSEFILCINMRDTIKPVITNVENVCNASLKKNVITVSASDTGTGLNRLAYSFDDGKTWQENNYFISDESLIVRVRDKVGLISDGVDVVVDEKCNVYKEEILNGTYPVLDEKMIAITYTETGIPKVADESSEWYSYASRKWANAVVLVNNPSKTYNVGDEIEESDIAAYFVWIPRYEYTLKGDFGVNGESKAKPGYVDIRFTNVSEESNGTASYTEGNPTNYRTQDAFKFGEEKLSGIWVGKFETTGSADNPTIKPGITSLRSQNVSTQFETAKKIGINNSLSLETSMMKNSEWNAVAILSQSIYGRCPSDSTCPEVALNNNTNFITGSATAGSTYNSEEGVKASTTMNITGVYDMNGLAAEWVMGVLLDSDGKPRSGYSEEYNSGYNGKLYNGGTEIEKTDGKTLPESKYYDSFTITGENTKVDLMTGCNGGKCYGTVEFGGWYDDYSSSIGPDRPWLMRGGGYVDGAGAGLWTCGGGFGDAYELASFRAVIRGT